MPSTVRHNNSVVAATVLSRKQQNRDLGQAEFETRDAKHMKSKQLHANSGMGPIGPFASESRPHSSDIEEKKNSIESWLKSKLSLEGSCKTMIEAHLVDKFLSRSVA